MQLIVRGRGVRVSSALREHSVERVERALSPFAEHVASTELVFSDLNGPRGGLGQSCRVSVGLSDGTKLMVQSLDTDFYAASSDAAARLGYLVRRELGKTRSLERRARRLTHTSAVAPSSSFP
jgi:ribosomal subunit interface protein